jgi:hypothetical protein
MIFINISAQRKEKYSLFSENSSKGGFCLLSLNGMKRMANGVKNSKMYSSRLFII